MSDKVQVTWHNHHIVRDQRERLNGHRGCVVWFTGLSGCGKSTVANVVDQRLHALGVHSFLLDGDNVRHGLNASAQLLDAEYGSAFAQRFGLGFTATDRSENIRRIGTVAQLFASAGLVTLVAFVSPYREDRGRARSWIEQQGRPGDFLEVFVNAPLDVCEARDPKGLYRQARAGKLSGLTGIDAPYEPPLHAELELDSAAHPPQELAAQVVALLSQRGIIGSGS